MTRSADFVTTIKSGRRVAQRALVIHSCTVPAESRGPRIGFVVSKAVGNAVQRHRVARRLRHAARAVLPQLQPADRIVIRALPGSRDAEFTRLQEEMLTALQQVGGRQRAAEPGQQR
jgi:ribonuclease P protein component